MDSRQLANRVWPEHEFADSIEAPVERKLIRNIALAIILAITVMVVWSIFATVEEIAKARGEVVPLGHRQVIESQQGGTLAQVNVEEGDVVKQGDIIAVFSAIDSQSTEEEIKSQRDNALMKIERFNAFVERRPADFSAYASDYSDLVSQQQSALDAMNEQYDRLEQSTESEKAKTQAEYQAIADEIPALNNQISAAQKTVGMMKELDESGVISDVQFLENQQKLDSYIRELKGLEGKEKVLAETLKNLDDLWAQKQAELFSETREKLTEAQAELLVFEARLRASSSQVAQTTIHAPVDGIIQSVPSELSGSVIEPGGVVAVIVPSTATAILETKLSPRDIGFVTVGQPARIKIDAFDYSRYGALDGIVQKISPTTDSDERGGVYYKVQIAIDTPYFGNDPSGQALIPGMTGEADIVTGDKTIFQYLWKPVFTNVSSAFGER